ncbi:MAG: YihY/virulence factor BrkB family protein [Bacteroidales bacterium]|jgi:membrane protein|nr:YihY/virulence factor BrkB family protein [Bacteroidales bacterium]
MANPVSWAFNQIKKWNDAIWHTPLSELSKRKSFLIKQVRIIVIAARGFLNDKVQIRAAALTLYTLLSIIPFVAIALAIAKGFGLDQNLESIITMSKEFQSYSGVLQPLLEKAKETVQSTRGGYIAGVGVIILFWSVISLLNQIETSFNHIWQISNPRAWYRKFTDYLTIMLIAPVLLIVSSSLTVFVSTELTEFMDKARILTFFKPIIGFLIKLSPYLLTWMILTLIFIIMPNARVKFMPALVSGIITGTVIQVLGWLYLDLQFGITRLSAIYGGLAAIPLFIILLQTSWLVILLGAELSFANQNISRYEFESGALNISHFQKRALVLMIMHMIIRNFNIGEKPISAEKISKSLKIPVRLARDILQDLSSSNLVSIIHEHESKEELYQPSLDINKLTVTYVLSRLERKGTDQKIVVRHEEYGRIVSILEKFEKLSVKSDSNILIKDL